MYPSRRQSTRVLLVIAALVAGATAVSAAPSGGAAPSLDDLLYITHPASLAVTMAVARSQTQTSPNYKSNRLEEFTVEGQYTPATDDERLAVLSDDGVDIYVDGMLVHNRLRRGQHLPFLHESFRVVGVDLKANEPVSITVVYSNVILTGPLDVDGVTLFVYKGAPGDAVDIPGGGDDDDDGK